MIEIDIVGKILPNDVYRADAVDKLTGEVVGSAFYGKQKGVQDFGPIQVNPPFRRQGIGTKLLVAIEDYAGNAIVGRFSPDIGDEKVAKAFYRKNGYEIDQEGLLRKK